MTPSRVQTASLATCGELILSWVHDHGEIMWCGTFGELRESVNDGRYVMRIRRAVQDRGLSFGPSEEKAWRESIEAFVRAVNDDCTLDQLNALIEVPLPGTSARADLVLLGMGGGGERGALVVELKQWPSATATKTWMVSWGGDRHILHPSAQVEGYRDYLSDYADALVDRTPESRVNACAFLHNCRDVEPFSNGDTETAAAANRSLVERCPVFGRNDISELRTWIRRELPVPPTAEFVSDFISLRKRASARLVTEFSDIVNRHDAPWTLLDKQREAMAVIAEAMEAIQEGSAPSRRVLLVTGPPGSGKTILALRTLLEAVGTYGLSQSAIVTTSGAQNKSLDGDISLARGQQLPPTRKLSRNPVIKSSSLRLDADRIKSKKAWGGDQASWIVYCDAWRSGYEAVVPEMPPYEVLVIDEAQGLVDPSVKHVSGSQASSWLRPFGPQAWHVMLNSRLSVFFMDEDQGYRQVESTGQALVRDLAQKEGIEVTEVNLESLQFRLSGASAFADWIDHILGFSENPPPAISPDYADELRRVFRVVDDLVELRDWLAERHAPPTQARLLATYAWEWRTKKGGSGTDSSNPKSGAISVLRRAPDLPFRWAGADLQREFNLGVEPYDTAKALFGDEAEPAIAGYPLTVRGRDFDYVGVMWGADLVRRKNRWLGDHELVFGSDMPAYRKAAREESRRGQPGDAMNNLVRALAGGLRILLTRGTQEVRLWIEDPETAAWFKGEWDRFLSSRRE